MSLISTGFDGSVQEPEVAQILAMSSGGGTVLGTDDWKVSAVTGNRRIAIAPGTGYDAFVYATEAASTLLDLVIPSTQTSGSRWFLICAERNWSTNATRFVALTGNALTATAAPRVGGTWGFTQNNDSPYSFPRNYPSSFQRSPGKISHQPLAWVFATVSSTALTVIDLRRAPARGIRMSDEALVLHSGQISNPALNKGTNGNLISLDVNVTEYTPVLVTGHGRWAAGGSVAGSHWLERNSEPISARFRLHNDSVSTMPMPLYAVARCTLPPGSSTLALRADNESGSAGVRGFADVNLTIFEL